MSNVNQTAQSVSGDIDGQSPAVQVLLDEHKRIRALLDQLTTASDVLQRQSTVKELQAILTVHNATEENIIYPALHAVAGEQLEPRKLYFETAEADMLLFELDNLAKGVMEGDFAGKAEKFAGALREHIEDEETKAFPHLQKKSDRATLAAVEAAVREFRVKLRFGSDETSRVSTATI